MQATYEVDTYTLQRIAEEEGLSVDEVKALLAKHGVTKKIFRTEYRWSFADRERIEALKERYGTDNESEALRRAAEEVLGF